MRILQICSAREIGGGERHLADLANALASRDHDVFAALVPGSPLVQELKAIPKENIFEVSMRNSLSLRSVMKLARLVREHRIEVIHAHVARDYPLAAMTASRAPSVALVLTRHVLFPLRKIHRLTLRRVARIIAVSRAVAEGLRAQCLFDPDKIVLIHNGIDVERFSKKDHERRLAEGNQNVLRVGMIGHLAPIKGQEDFIRAAANVCARRDDVEFVIAGEDKSRTGAHRRQIENLISELKLSERVRLAGWVNNVAQLLSTLDLFVSPARSEPFGLTIIEAMAGGVPVLATMSEGAREIIETDKTGSLVPVGDVEGLAKAMHELLDDPKRRQRLAANAQRAVREQFSLERMVEETERVYREVVDVRNSDR